MNHNLLMTVEHLFLVAWALSTLKSPFMKQNPSFYSHNSLQACSLFLYPPPDIQQSSPPHLLGQLGEFQCFLFFFKYVCTTSGDC